MRCDKCDGLVIDDCGDVRCLNCGRRRRRDQGGAAVPSVREPDVVVARRAAQLGGSVLPLLDAAIASAHADLDALERTKAILARQARVAGPFPA